MGALYKRVVLEDDVVEYEHRVVAERILGRKLKQGEQVHHIDENKRNNSEENLIVFRSCSDHITFHNGGMLIKNDDGTYSSKSELCTGKICPTCNNMFNAKYKEQKFCSTKCASKSMERKDKPSPEELVNLLKKSSFDGVGRMYGISGNSVKKWCKRYGISDKAADYKERKEKKPRKQKLLTLEQANEIRRLRLEMNYTQVKLAEMFKVSRGLIRDILLNKCYIKQN